jgi:hypothetical protein
LLADIYTHLPVRTRHKNIDDAAHQSLLDAYAMMDFLARYTHKAKIYKMPNINNALPRKESLKHSSAPVSLDDIVEISLEKTFTHLIASHFSCDSSSGTPFSSEEIISLLYRMSIEDRDAIMSAYEKLQSVGSTALPTEHSNKILSASEYGKFMPYMKDSSYL